MAQSMGKKVIEAKKVTRSTAGQVKATKLKVTAKKTVAVEHAKKAKSGLDWKM